MIFFERYNNDDIEVFILYTLQQTFQIGSYFICIKCVDCYEYMCVW